MAVTVIGIDSSLSATGVARVTFGAAECPTRLAETWSVRTQSPGMAAIRVREARIRHIATQVLDYARPCALAAIEGPSLGSRDGYVWDRAGLWWRLVGALIRAEVPVAVIPPACRAKWATGHGGASKAAVRHAITRTWHGYWHDSRGDHNESDALVLASMGAQWLDLAEFPNHDPAALDGAQWPDRDEVA